jgi:phosphatidylserine/phosphatidylglycerophosphate/cardiolipin synthase-like enzyme
MRQMLAGWAAGMGAGILLWAVPGQGADLREQIVAHIDSARSSVDVVVYEIRSNDIAEALIAAKHRGVQVRVIVDSVHSPIATAQERALEEDGVPIKRVSGVSRKLLHDKFILFDGQVASTPSYNRSARSLRASEENGSEFTHDKELVTRLQGEFNDVWKSARFQDLPEN